MRHDELYLADAVEAIRQLHVFVAGLSEAEFLADPLKQSYVFHRLVIVGEAAVSLRRTYEVRYPEVPWAQLAGLRNRLVHAYFDLNLERLWAISVAGVDRLGRQFEEILAAEFPNTEELGT